MTDKKSGARRASRTKEAAARMHARELRFIQNEDDTSFDRDRAARRSHDTLHGCGMIIRMELVLREGVTGKMLANMANTLRLAGFIPLAQHRDAILLDAEPGLAIAFMARAAVTGVLGSRFRRDLGGIIRDRSLIRKELKDQVKNLIFPSIASVEPPRKG